ncbi:sushi, von Willebrand factor type A, EGF and pentraxin domain-containing protein 1-like [Anneissia japonica]|uniref:sushi, von Willebrand factor type A, EGF and pentraxin domain-containing protein 1-like n=1 Tax=Anneissia japonica TaxID=1529436 RepID=UPI001425A9E1|nr:sushi, von Willebrand factor type A, EGF and pentraxin domain-containing protein 1-like [Anneissia japonica]
MFRLTTVGIIIGLISDVNAVCLRPEEHTHTETFINDRYSFRYNLDEEFPEGTTLVSRCQDIGRYRFDGSTVRKCTKGSWSAPPPKCTQSEAQLIIQTYAKFEESNNGSFIIVVPEDKRKKLMISCRVGEPELIIELYNKTAKVPSNTKHFRATKTIVINKPNPSYSGLYKCNDALNDREPQMEVEIIILETAPMCEVPQAPKNGKRSRPGMDEVTMTSEIVYSCDDGFSLEGAQFTKCTSSGLFNSDPPTCVANLCKPPPPNTLMNGQILGAEYYVGDTLGFLCDDGFNIDGKSLFSVECRPSLMWSDEFPEGCLPNPTSPPVTTAK